MIYRILIDGVDATADVIEATWRLGVKRADDRVGTGRGRLIMDNETGVYGSERMGALAMAQGTPVSIDIDDGGSWRRLFTGEVAYTEPQAGDYGRRMVTLSIVTVESRLLHTMVRPGLLLDVRSDEAIEAVLSHVDLDGLPRDVGEGAARFASFGEQWGGGAAALRVIQAVAQAEGGRFMADREGVVVFRGRDYGLSAGDPDATLAGLGEDAAYTYGGEVYNRVRVSIRPRRVGTPNTVLWRLDGAQRIRPNRPLTMIVRLRDSQGRGVGAAYIETPTAGVDYVANTQPDGSGTDKTGNVSVSIVAIEGGAVTLSIENSGANAVYVLAGAQVRGTPVLGGDVAWVERSDHASAAAYGPRTLSLPLPLLDSVEAGEARADFELAGRSDPRGVLARLTLSERAGFGYAMARSLFDRVRVIDPHTGHDGVYTIIGELHRVTMGGTRHQTVWTLERLPMTAYWTVGVGMLGGGTALAG
jgi:hypothetical protein